MSAPKISEDELTRCVEAALREDLGDRGDVTTDAVIGPGHQATGKIVARSRLVVCGLPVARAVFRRLDPSLEFFELRRDGDEADAGTVVAKVSGDPRPILAGERTVLNFAMRMSGIATAARAALLEVAGTGARILDTRKTAPGLRALDKYAVAVGGAENHRFGLYDAIMIKDTHLGVERDPAEAVAKALAAGHPPERVTLEVRTIADLEAGIRAGAGRALLDNMDVETMRRAVAVAAGRIVLEASGGLRAGRLREVAETGVDFLSIGALTHSAAAADLALEMEVRS